MRYPPHVDTEESLRAQARDLRQRLRRVLGERRARAVWDEINDVKRGRIPGERTYDNPEPLLHVYDVLRGSPANASATREELARAIAEQAHARSRGKFGATVVGITATIKRRLQEREKLRAEQKAYAEQLAALMAEAAELQKQIDRTRSPLAAALLGITDMKMPGLLSGGHEKPG